MSRWHDAPVNRREWRRVRLQVLDRDGYRCTACGKAGILEVDHIVELKAGGAPLALFQSSLSLPRVPY